MRKAGLDRGIALAQRVVGRVGDLRRVLLVVQLIVMRDLPRELREFRRGVLFRQASTSRPHPPLRSGGAIARHVMPPLPQQIISRCPGGLGDRFASQHASDLLAPLRRIQLVDPRRRAPARRLLRHPQMRTAARGNLWTVRHDQHLHPLRHPRQPLADRRRRGSSDIGINLVEHQGRHR